LLRLKLKRFIKKMFTYIGPSLNLKEKELNLFINTSVGDRDRVADRNPKSSDRDLKKKIAIENFLDRNPQADCDPNCNRLRWIA
jgi:hypothetical protein